MSRADHNDTIEQVFTWVVIAVVVGISYAVARLFRLDFWHVLIATTLYLSANTTLDSWRHQAESDR